MTLTTITPHRPIGSGALMAECSLPGRGNGPLNASLNGRRGTRPRYRSSLFNSLIAWGRPLFIEPRASVKTSNSPPTRELPGKPKK